VEQTRRGWCQRPIALFRVVSFLSSGPELPVGDVFSLETLYDLQELWLESSVFAIQQASSIVNSPRGGGIFSRHHLHPRRRWTRGRAPKAILRHAPRVLDAARPIWTGASLGGAQPVGPRRDCLCA